MSAEVKDYPERHRFELPIEGDAVALAYYRVEGDRLILTHTEVPNEYGGQGIGSRLARGVFDAIRASGRQAVLKCPFLGAFYARHPEYADIVDG